MVKFPERKTLFLRMITRLIHKKTMFNFHVIDTFQLGKVFGKLKTSKGCGMMVLLDVF